MEFSVRRVAPADAEIIAHHRAAMFRDMGSVPVEQYDALRTASLAAIERLLARERYVGWLAAPTGDLSRVVSGVGVHLRTVQPFAKKGADGRVSITAGKQALVVNVYTEPEFRRRGVARLLMRAMMAWAGENAIDSLVLHAAADGRPLYESLGFTPTNEMRFQGELRGATQG
jgi:GNAT superfamily N-acetyltransferase